jgi:hypothetical protein
VRLRLPEGRLGRREPLVTTGVAGRGDFLFVEYLEGGRLRLGLDSWGAGTLWSEPLALDRAKEHEIKAVFGALAGPAILGQAEADADGRLQVTVDGQVVWERVADFHPAKANQVYVGANPLGGTACEEKFTGVILGSRRGN